MTPLLLAAAATLCLATGARAAPPCPTSPGPPLLVVDGRIGCDSASGSATFDRDQLDALGPVVVETSTIWTAGTHRFTGVPLARLLQAVGAEGDAIRAFAINEYAVDIPREDWTSGGPVVAYLMDGRPMPVRNMGPLWIVYPWDDRPHYQDEATYARSVWQLTRIQVLD